MPTNFAVPVRELRDLAYAANGHTRQKLDLYLPTSAQSQKPPLVVYIHGGAFRAGDKSSDLMPRRYLEKGYAIASLNYRLSQDAIFPAQIEDCKAAVRWLRAHANEYGFDADRFVAWGESAGGYLAAMLGAAGAAPQFEVGDNLQFSSRVQAVVDYYGPTDFLQMDAHLIEGGETHNQADSPESQLVGGPIQEHPDAVQAANPISYISPECPPFLIAHGKADRLVPFHQSQLLCDALTRANCPMTFLALDHAGHVFEGASEEQIKELERSTDLFLASVIARRGED